MTVVAGTIAAATLLVAVPAVSHSDGHVGGTGLIPEHLRECAPGFQYCMVQPRLCSGCHGTVREMEASVDGQTPAIERLSGRVLVEGTKDIWEYEPGATLTVRVSIVVDDAAGRPPGQGNHSDGAFNLAVSNGTLAAVPGDATVRIADGSHVHCRVDSPSNCTTTDESRNIGEATQTHEGLHQRAWDLLWTAPAAGDVPGVAIYATVMLPDGDGDRDDCTIYVNCTMSEGYADPSTWDWWTPYLETGGVQTDRRAFMLCEAGVFADAETCFDAVGDEVYPPQPGSDPGPGPTTGASPTTEAASPGPTTPNQRAASDTPEAIEIPQPAAATALFAAFAAAMILRRRT